MEQLILIDFNQLLFKRNSLIDVHPSINVQNYYNTTGR
jgi:hypothetical protein